VAFAPDGRTLATGGLTGAVRFWDAHDGHPLGPPHAGPHTLVRALAFSPDGTRLAVADNGARVTLWDTRTQKALAPVLRGMRWIDELAFGPDGHMLAGIGSDTDFGETRVRLWDLRDPARPGRLLRRERGPFAAQLRALAAGHDDPESAFTALANVGKTRATGVLGAPATVRLSHRRSTGPVV